MAKEANVGHQDGHHNTGEQRRGPSGNLVRAKAAKFIVREGRNSLLASHLPKIRIGLECSNRLGAQKQKHPHAFEDISTSFNSCQQDTHLDPTTGVLRWSKDFSIRMYRPAGKVESAVQCKNSQQSRSRFHLVQALINRLFRSALTSKEQGNGNKRPMLGLESLQEWR